MKKFLLFFALFASATYAQVANRMATDTVFRAVFDNSKCTQSTDFSLCAKPLVGDVNSHVDAAIQALVNAAGRRKAKQIFDDHKLTFTGKYPMSFSYYKIETINNGQVRGGSPITGFPAVLAFLGGESDLKSVANGGFVQSANGYDIRPFADAAFATPLPFDLVNYNGSPGAFEMWVKITAQDGQKVYLAYGDPTIVSDGSSTSAWDSNYKLVAHLSNGSRLSAHDSTSGGIGDGNVTSATATSGKLDGGADFVAANSAQIDFGTPTINYGAATFSVWMKASSVAGTIFTQWTDSPVNAQTFILDHRAGSGHARFLLRTSLSGIEDTAKGTTNVAYQGGGRSPHFKHQSVGELDRD
jgi:hypothetical protein